MVPTFVSWGECWGMVEVVAGTRWLGMRSVGGRRDPVGGAVRWVFGSVGGCAELRWFGRYFEGAG